ncbi:MAG: hypothetical protein LBH44_12030 [Treponema sp.]|jgi:hypothetical protein|nr:hypothetical protein [Treponema sp.]
MNRRIKTLLILPAFLFVISCVSTPLFDQAEYDRAIILKVEVLLIFENMTKDFHLYQGDVLKIRKDLLIMMEYAKRKPNAEFIAIKQAGLAKIELERLTSGLIKIIVDTAFRLLL